MTTFSHREIYHHRGILVVDKPSGLASQPTQKREENLYDRLQESHGYVGLHHRLDRPASGLLLLCTDKRCNKAIAQAFQRRQIGRTYQAIVLGSPPPNGIWQMPIDGMDAQSEYSLVSQHDGFALLEISLKTGRTHQIRKHAQGAGHPIVGDRRYGGAAGRLWPRLCLHAVEIRFTHPLTGELTQCRSEMPINMSDALIDLGAG